MPHGTPDWGLVRPKKTTYGLDDLGEHAVRLGSPHLWDRRGEVVYQSIFADGLEGAHPIFVGVVGYARLWTDRARQGAYCVKVELEHGVDYRTALEWYLPYPVRSGVGCEFSFREQEEGGWWYVAIVVRNQTLWYEGRVRVDEIAGTLEYWDTTGNWAPLTAGGQYQMYRFGWHTLKLVVMFDLGYYSRVILDDETYDMSAIPLYPGGGAGANYLRVQVGKWSHPVVDVEGYIDSVIVTQNEP